MAHPQRAEQLTGVVGGVLQLAHLQQLWRCLLQGCQAFAQLFGGQAAAVQAQGDMGQVGRLADFRGMFAQALAPGLQLPGRVLDGQDGGAGKAVRGANLQAQARAGRTAQFAQLALLLGLAEIVVQVPPTADKTADKQADMGLAPSLGVQQVGQLQAQPGDMGEQGGALHRQQPEPIAAATAVPLGVIA